MELPFDQTTLKFACEFGLVRGQIPWACYLLRGKTRDLSSIDRACIQAASRMKVVDLQKYQIRALSPQCLAAVRARERLLAYKAQDY